MGKAVLLPIAAMFLAFAAPSASALSPHVEAARDALSNATAAPENSELFCAFLGTFNVSDDVDDQTLRDIEQRREFLVSAMGPAFQTAWDLTVKTPEQDSQELTEVLAEFDQQCLNGTDNSAGRQ